MITQKLTSSQPRSHFLTANLGDYCLHHNQPSISSLKTTSTKADTPSFLPKEDTLPRCQAPAETPDCQSSQTVKPNSHNTCHHRGDLHRVPHRKSTPTSHFHFPIKREQYPSKRGIGGPLVNTPRVWSSYWFYFAGRRRRRRRKGNLSNRIFSWGNLYKQTGAFIESTSYIQRVLKESVPPIFQSTEAFQTTMVGSMKTRGKTAAMAKSATAQSHSTYGPAIDMVAPPPLTTAPATAAEHGGTSHQG
ncbi:unnamed protein product [Prunus armeniaca]